jgi:hypothetical protein
MATQGPPMIYVASVVDGEKVVLAIPRPLAAKIAEAYAKVKAKPEPDAGRNYRVTMRDGKGDPHTVGGRYPSQAAARAGAAVMARQWKWKVTKVEEVPDDQAL